MSSRLIRRPAIGLGVLLFSGCSPSAEPLPQLVIVLDTDVPVVDQIATHPELSNDAAMDTVRIDVLDDHDRPFDFIDVTAADPLDWPVSFGVATNGRQQVRVRARLFRAQHAVPGALEHRQTLEPDPNAAIDRIIDLKLPAEGVTKARVFLSGDCIGVKPSFASPARTCIDAARLDAPASDGITTTDGDAPSGTRVGTWARAREVPCSKPSDDERICIPGGFSLLGDAGLKGVSDGILVRVDATPLRPVILTPFYLDKTEVTVGAFDALRKRQPNAITGPLPSTRNPAAMYEEACTWRGGGDGTDAHPLNCIEQTTARQVCAARGGDLPSEAQWEHAARGRGQRRLYPWGDARPTNCCIAAVDCGSVAVFAVGSYPSGRERCQGLGDVSRDGVLDMAGSLRERTLDVLASYDDPCWRASGIPTNPVCTVGDAMLFVSRGTSWYAPATSALASLRQSVVGLQAVASVGFRCAYPDGGP